MISAVVCLWAAWIVLLWLRGLVCDFWSEISSLHSQRWSLHAWLSRSEHRNLTDKRSDDLLSLHYLFCVYVLHLWFPDTWSHCNLVQQYSTIVVTRKVSDPGLPVWRILDLWYLYIFMRTEELMKSEDLVFGPQVSKGIIIIKLANVLHCINPDMGHIRLFT